MNPTSTEPDPASLADPAAAGRRPGQLLNFASAWAFYLATVFLFLGSRTGDLPPGFYAFTRYVLGFAIFGAWYFLERERLPRRGDGAVRFLILRGVFNLLALVCFYQSVAGGAAGKANVLNMTYPAFVALLAGPMLGEAPDRRTVALIALAVTGMLLNIFDWKNGPALPSVADAWGIASGVAAGFAIVSLRGAARVASPIEILCWMFGLGAVALLPFNLPEIAWLARRVGDGFNLPGEVYYILASAGCGILGQWSLSVSYRYLDASSGSVISASRIPIALVAGVLFLGEALELWPWLGAALILMSNVLLATRKTKAPQPSGL
ncbi:MAG: DMT family transporter [Leptospirales bacterium]|jgi:drug/metabolite transporter (DMT)-like permease